MSDIFHSGGKESEQGKISAAEFVLQEGENCKDENICAEAAWRLFYPSSRPVNVKSFSVRIVKEEKNIAILSYVHREDQCIKIAQTLNSHRFQALQSLIRIRCMQPEQRKEDYSKAAGVVIVTPEGVFLEKKIPPMDPSECEDKYSLFGGNPYVRENIWKALARELYEEIWITDLADNLLGNVQFCKKLELPKVQWKEEGKEEYDLYPCFSFIIDEEMITQWEKMVAIGTTESAIEFISWDRLKNLICEEEGQAGRHFISSVHVFLKQILEHKDAIIRGGKQIEGFTLDQEDWMKQKP